MWGPGSGRAGAESGVCPLVLHGLGPRLVLAALHLLVAIDQFDDGHRRRVAVAIASLEHPRIAAGPILVARPQGIEQLLDHGLITHARRGQAARVEVAALGQGDVLDRKSTRLNSSHLGISYAVFCLKKKMNL